MKLVRDIVQIELDEMPKTDEKQWEQVPNTGKIITRGEGALLFNDGDHVVFNGYAILQVKIGEENINLLREHDILGTL